MGVRVFPTRDGAGEREDWRAEYLRSLNAVLDQMEGEDKMEKLWDITRTMVENKSEILGQLTLAFVKRKHANSWSRSIVIAQSARKNSGLVENAIERLRHIWEVSPWSGLIFTASIAT